MIEQVIDAIEIEVELHQSREHHLTAPIGGKGPDQDFVRLFGRAQFGEAI